MKQELIKKIDPIIESFVDKVLDSFSDLETIRKDAIQEQRKYQDLVENKDLELSLTKQQRNADRVESDRRITELNKAKDDFIDKSKTYDDLINEARTKEREIAANLGRIRIELIRATEERAEADKTREDAKKVETTYNLKLNSLKTDTEKLSSDHTKYEDNLKRLKSRENEFYAKEIKHNQKVIELKDLELQAKVERKETNRLIKRYHLEKKLKE